MFQFAVINESGGLVTPKQIAYYVVAQNYQFTNHFAPAWNIRAACRAAANPTDIKADEIPLHILKNPTQAGALGYHDDPGKVEAFVFAETAIQGGVTWESVASHEALETAADPMINCLMLTDTKGAVANEVGDPVEDVYDDIKFKDGSVVRLSDFVYPEWFVEATRPGTRLSFKGSVSKPLAITPGGYFQYTTDLKSWQQVVGARHVRELIPILGRKARRESRGH